MDVDRQCQRRLPQSRVGRYGGISIRLDRRARKIENASRDGPKLSTNLESVIRDSYISHIRLGRGILGTCNLRKCVTRQGTFFTGYFGKPFPSAWACT